MNALKLFSPFGFLFFVVTPSFADSRSDFSDCIENKTQAAQALRLPLAEFIQTMKGACKPQELNFVTELSMTSMSELKEVKESNARQQRRSEAYVSESREANTIFYSKWLASTAR